MSRVDEALRRVAERAAADATVAAETSASVSASTGLVEAFPDEVPPNPPPSAPVARTRPSATAPVEPRMNVEDPPIDVAVAEAEVDREEAWQNPADEDAPRARSRRRAKAGSIFEHIDSRLTEKIVIDQNMLPASREQYRRLAAVLHDAQGAKGLKVLMIVSATAGEGKTLTAANLALTFSESYQRRVLLIDADLRRPALHGVFKIDTASGLSDGLADPNAKLTVRQVSPRLAVLPAGRPSADPMAGLTSERMRQLINEARESFDWVIIDTPPIGLLPDAHLLSSMVEGAVMVIRAGSTPHELVRRAVDTVGRNRIIGVVLNNAATRGGTGTGYDYYGYGYGYGYSGRDAIPEKTQDRA